jgi:cell division protein ZapA (FtsZ GTPase activity inhibitor)
MSAVLEDVAPPKSISQPRDQIEELKKALAVNLAQSTKRIDVGQSAANGLAQLVMALINLIHELLERQAIRRIDAGSLTPEQTERVADALMQQAQTIAQLCDQLGLTEEDLNLDLGPLGKLT